MNLTTSQNGRRKPVNDTKNQITLLYLGFPLKGARLCVKQDVFTVSQLLGNLVSVALLCSEEGGSGQ